MRLDIRREIGLMRRQMVEKYNWIWIFVVLVTFIIGSICLSPVNALEDSFQYTSLSDNWDSTYAEIVTYKNYTKTVTGIFECHGTCKCYIIKNKKASPSNYWAFAVRDTSKEPNYNHCPGLMVRFYNSSNVLIKSGGDGDGNCPQTDDAFFWTRSCENCSNTLFEFVRLNNKIYVFKNGTLISDTPLSCNETPAYIEIYVYAYLTGYGGWLWLDDITNEDGYILGMGEYGYDHSATEFDDEEIEVSYITNQYYDSGSDFDLNIRRVSTGAIVNTTHLIDPAGMIVYNRTKILGYNYGLYQWELTKNGQLMDYDYLYYVPPSETSYLAFNKETYTSNEIGTITYDIANPDFSSHNYYIKIFDIYGNEKKKWHVTKESGSISFDTSELGTGTYYAILMQYSDPVELAYDMTQIEEKVDIEGVSYNAKSETVLGTVNVNASQGTVWHNTTTNVTTGYYNLTDFIVDEAIQMNASKTNYIHNNFSFTPLQSGLYNIDLFLLPDENHININPPAIVGLVQSYPFYQNVSEATVNLWNDTIGLATNNTTNSMGYFQFILDNTSMQTSDIVNETFNSSEYDTWVNLANSGIVPYTEKVTNTTDENPYYRGTDYEMDYVSGKIKVLSTGNMSNNTDYHIDYEKYEATTYSINATKFKYEQMNQPQTFTVNGTEIKYVYLLMNPIFNLTVRARSADTHATIMEFNTILNDGDVVQTTTGYINFSVNYGIHKVEVSADGYYPQVSYVYVAQDTEKVIYLTPLEEAGGAGTYYPPPHLVEFKVQNVWGQPLSGINVTAVPSETSMVNWNWIRSVYGYGENISQTMSGITDSNGAVSFVMVETIKYKMYFTNESQNISAYREIYPKDDRYVITIGEIPEEKIGWWLSTAQNDTANTGNITIHYLDYNEPVKTQWVNFSIYFLDNDTLVYSHNFTTVNATNENTSIDLNASYAYKVKITAYHEDYGVISSTTIIVFVIPEKPKLPVAQELFKHLEPWQITMISMFVLICFGFIFGAISAGTGGLIVAAMAAGFYYFGLLPSLSKEVASIVIPLMLIVAVVNKLIEQRGVIRE